MSVQITRAKTDSCAFDNCDQQFQVRQAVAGSYCSQDCADRADAAGLLSHIRTDHKFCATCFGLKKDIDPPKPARDFDKSGTGWVPTGPDTASIERFGQEVSMAAAVGFEHHTDRVERGPYGLECVCGCVSHDAVDEDMRRDEPFLWNLKTTVDHLREERDKTDKRLDIVTLANELWDGADLELAFGRALSD